MDCHVCGGSGISKCSICEYTRYCSKECQRKDWKTHKDICKINIDMGLKSSSKLIDFDIIRPLTIFEVHLEYLDLFATDDYDSKSCPILISATVNGEVELRDLITSYQPVSFKYGTFRCTTEQIASLPTIKQWKEQLLFLDENDRKLLSGDSEWNWAWSVAYHSIEHNWNMMIPGMMKVLLKIRRIPTEVFCSVDEMKKYIMLIKSCIPIIPPPKKMKKMDENTRAILDIRCFLNTKMNDFISEIRRNGDNQFQMVKESCRTRDKNQK